MHQSTSTVDDRTHVDADAVVVEVLPPDVRTMDLSRSAARSSAAAPASTREERFAQLDTFAGRIGGVMGATRVITDRGWVHHDRQIGTTGVVVDPTLYLSFGVSGAVQHTSGLGAPDHIISVNTDPHCPMMAMSDLAIVSDANATLDELLRCCSARTGPTDSSGGTGVSVDVDVVVVGAGPAGCVRRHGARPRRPLGRSCSSAGRSPARRTCTAAWCTRASSTSSTPSGGTRRRSSGGSPAARR